MIAFRKLGISSVCIATLVASSAHAIISDNHQAAQEESIRLLLLKEDFKKLATLLHQDQESLQTAVESGSKEALVDLRNRTFMDDMRDYLISKQDVLQIDSITSTFKQAVALRNVENAIAQVQALRSILETAPDREDAIKAYWSAIKSLDREHQLWLRALEIDGLPADTPHDASVIAAEVQFRDTVLRDTVLKDTWKPLLNDLVPALIADRNRLARRVAADLSRSTSIKYYANSLAVASSRDTTTINGLPSGKNNQINAITTTTERPTVVNREFTQARLKQPIPNLDDYFPASCKRKGEEGVVILSIKVDRNGSPISAGVVASSGSDILDGAALAFYEKLKFDPANRDGTAVDTTIKLPVNFRLEQYSSDR